MQPLPPDWTASLLQIAVILGGVALAAFQYLIKKWVTSLETDMRDMQAAQKDITHEISHIRENYVSKIDLREIRHELLARLDRIEGHLLERKRDV